jgi:guanine deaminase
MDNPDFCPPYYKDLSADDSVSATRSTIEYIHALDPKGTLVKPIITPRFAPTCTRPALEGLGKLAAEFNPPLHIQTHISENTNECALVKELFPESESYADVYDRYNLLTKRTILAHAVHLTPDERNLIRQRDAKISHCPASNSALGSGIAPVRTLLDEGITVGLGTDVSGGYLDYSGILLHSARRERSMCMRMDTPISLLSAARNCPLKRVCTWRLAAARRSSIWRMTLVASTRA